MTVTAGLQLALEHAEGKYWHELAASLSLQEREALRITHVKLGNATLELMSHDGMIPLFNRTTELGLRRPVTDSDLDEIQAVTHSHSVPAVMMCVHPLAQPSGLEARLIDRGARPTTAWMQLSREPEMISMTPGTVEVQEVSSAQIEQVADLIIRGFGWPEDLGLLFSRSGRQPGFRYYLATVNGQPAGGAALYT